MNPWDWLGHGVYFWEHSPSRALEFAAIQSSRKGSSIKKPAILGAVLDLGNCLDLLDYGSLFYLKQVHDEFRGHPDFENLLTESEAIQRSTDSLRRNLDCAILELAHRSRRRDNLPPFDSVRAVFFEGNTLYPNAGFREKNHIQICIRNPNCIKGLFIPYP